MKSELVLKVPEMALNQCNVGCIENKWHCLQHEQKGQNKKRRFARQENKKPIPVEPESFTSKTAAVEESA